MPLPDEHPGAYAEWVAANGIENSFRTHLILTQQIPSTTVDRLMIAKQAAQTMTNLLELEIAIAQAG